MKTLRFLIKLQTSPTQVFSLNIAKFLRAAFLKEHLRWVLLIGMKFTLKSVHIDANKAKAPVIFFKFDSWLENTLYWE